MKHATHQPHDQRRSARLRRATAALLLALSAMFALAALASPATASTLRPTANTGQPVTGSAGGSSAAATGRHNAFEQPRAVKPISAYTQAELTSTIVAGVIILGAAGVVLGYTAFRRDSYY